MEEYPYVNWNISQKPYFRVGPNRPLPGMSVEIIGLLTSYLNLTIDVVSRRNYSADYRYVYDQIQNNETDLFTSFFMNTSSRAKKFDFSHNVYVAHTKIAVRRTDHRLKNMFDFFNVYCLNSWIVIIAVFVLFTAFGLLVRYVECQLKFRKECNAGEFLWKMVVLILLTFVYSRRLGGSSFLTFSLFQLCIILGLFQGFILTSVVRKVNMPPFGINDDFPQMVKQKKLFIVVSELLDWYYQEIETSYVSAFYELRDALTFNPYRVVETDEDVLRTVDEGNGAVAFVEEDNVIAFKVRDYCNLVLVDSHMPSGHARLMFRKGSKFVKMFNEAIKANKYRIKLIKRKYLEYKPISKCALIKHGPIPLPVTPYYGLLIMLFVGTSSACFVFSGELLKWKVFRK